jgi:hypothetical protein
MQPCHLPPPLPPPRPHLCTAPSLTPRCPTSPPALLPPPAPTSAPASAPIPTSRPRQVITRLPEQLALSVLRDAVLLVDKPRHWSTSEALEALK